MIFATIRNGTRDGELVFVHPNRKHIQRIGSYAPTFQAMLDDYAPLEPQLLAQYAQFDKTYERAEPIETVSFLAPLPRAYEFVDGSAYINHIVLVRKARKAEIPATLYTDPLVYQAGSSCNIAHQDPIYLANVEWGLDFEAEVAVILGDTPQGTTQHEAHKYIRCVLLCNDITLRNLIPDELQKGFGFFQSKPATAFSPFALTPNMLGNAWQNGKVHLPLRSTYNGQLIGEPNAGPEMHFSFYQLIEHICKTRSYAAGTILGSGTVSNADITKGVSCFAEKRMLEILNTGKAHTSFMKPGDQIHIEMLNEQGVSLFGAIDQTVTDVRPT